VCTNCRIFNALDNETFRPLKIFAVARQRFYRPRRDAAVKLIGIGEVFVEQRFRAENAKVRQCASAEQDAIGPDKTIIAYAYRLGGLPILFDVDAMSDDLRMKSGECREPADGNRIRAIKQVTVGDGRVLAKDQLRTAVCLVRKMARWTERKAGDPIAAADGSVWFEMEEIDVLAHSRGADPAAFFHDQAGWKNPRPSNARARMDFVVELFFEKRPPQFPGQKEAKQHQDGFHNCAPRLR